MNAFIINVTLLAGYCICGSLIPLRLQHNYLRRRFRTCCRRVHLLGVKDSPLNFSAFRTIPPVTATILAVCPVPYHAVVEQEQLSVKLEYLSIVRFPGMAIFLFIKCFRRLRVRMEDKLLHCFCSGCNPCLRLYMAGKGENHPSGSQSLPFEAFLAFFSLGPPCKVLFGPPFKILRLFFAKECTSNFFSDLPSLFHFAFSFSPLHLAAVEWS